MGTVKAGSARVGDGEPAFGRGMASGLIAVVMWGLAPVATRAVVADVAPLHLAALRTLIAGVALLPWCVPVLRRLDRATVVRLVAAGLLGMVGYNLPVALGIQWLPASTAALILATEPIWILGLGRVFLAESVSARAWGGSAVALTGIAVLAGPNALHAESGGRTLEGFGLVMLGTALFGAYTIVLRPLSLTLGPLAATAASTAAGAVPYLALTWMIPAHQLAALPRAAWGELAFLALGSTVAGMLLWNLAVARSGSSRAGLLLFLEPLVGVIGGITLLGERLSPGSAVGGVLITLGVTIAWTAQRRAGTG
ncbi:threonine/homoserine efflux transporter RhtA [Actinocorallia herbida]|uniref:Threonine/homoserine efflux transporter RhtA n=2 Tax=Actinocorallia herbida TaxID=58109 RepID=A0A3N1D1H7_9ACTN|nr:threonine/homoserine efflux transporter RhtA [Actinocorallia herbida]